MHPAILRLIVLAVNVMFAAGVIAASVPTCNAKGNYDSRFVCNHPQAEIFQEAAVTSSNGICSDIGRDLLKLGGNAVDAAIGVAICLGAASPELSGLGGGHFTTIYMRLQDILIITVIRRGNFRKQNRCSIINAREMAPLGSTENMFYEDPEASQYGNCAKSIAVPGELHGLWVAFTRFRSGKLAWNQLLEPTIKLCFEGFPKAQGLPDSMHMFYNVAKQRPYNAGEIVKCPQLGKALKALANAKNPVSLFYNSALTSSMVSEIKREGGILSVQDFRQYAAKLEPALDMQLDNGLRACAPYPPASGALVLGSLNILQGLSDGKAEKLVDLYHRFVEATKFAFGERSSFADPCYEPSAKVAAERMIQPIYGEATRKLITSGTHPAEYYGNANVSSKVGGTAHISVVDAEGNAVSLTPTINTYYGSKLASQETGIVWNSHMDDFSTSDKPNAYGFVSTKINAIQRCKRPLSSCAPTIVYDQEHGHVELATGAAGGSRIISTLVLMIQRVLQLNETLQDVGDSARLHTQLHPNEIVFEEGLEAVNHQFHLFII
ncbi:unnamed protein product [Soboliphyme baturini]|uniref:Gamma-glutamyltransferase n=1 Tax=Soboliphyme baturini TaxID=241478 RepID=A0A183IUQ7_9BILA|nr:unnamed protein product [Soboliphyme baturini]